PVLVLLKQLRHRALFDLLVLLTAVSLPRDIHKRGLNHLALASHQSGLMQMCLKSPEELVDLSFPD
ncbi:MAG: hypothetical protein OEY12_16395, partial [Nitrospira sp.]|nr:hypothetical protein [Nitrospira sp.]